MSEDFSSINEALLSNSKTMPIYIPTAEATAVSDDGNIGYSKMDPFHTDFTVYTPTVTTGISVQEDGPKWQIHGHDMQVLHVDNLKPGDEFHTEVGSTMYLSPGMNTDVECGLCGDAAPRVLSGESCIKVKLTNESDSSGYVGLTPNFPGKIIPITLSNTASSSNEGKAMTTLIAKPGAIMSNIGSDVEVTCNMDFNPIRVCCAGLGCCRQQISGGHSGYESTAFLAAGGTIMTKVLKEGETITVDKRSILAFADTVTLDVRPVGGACFCLCGGEGCFLPTLTGPGLILLESMSFQKIKQALTPVQQQQMDRDASADEGGGNVDVGDFF